MTGSPLEHGLMAAAVLFAIGLVGLLVRRNLLFMSASQSLSVGPVETRGAHFC